MKKMTLSEYLAKHEDFRGSAADLLAGLAASVLGNDHDGRGTYLEYVGLDPDPAGLVGSLKNAETAVNVYLRPGDHYLVVLADRHTGDTVGARRTWDWTVKSAVEAWRVAWAWYEGKDPDGRPSTVEHRPRNKMNKNERKVLLSFPTFHNMMPDEERQTKKGRGTDEEG